MFCPQCGKQASEEHKFCSECGRGLKLPNGSQPVPKASEEVIFYSNEGVKVTNTRLVVPDKIYAMANITSVSTKKIAPKYHGVALLILVAALFFVIGELLGSGGMAGFGLVPLLGGIAWATLLKPQYDLRISSSGHESSVLERKDQAYVDKLVGAIQQAMVHRG
jgi:cadmium resistance protein CadD (predicted permease)